MKQFNLNKDENILSSKKGSKQYIVIQFISAIAAAALAIVLMCETPSDNLLLSNVSSNVGKIFVAIGEAIAITLFCFFLNEVIKTATTRVILTDQRFVYMQSGINAKNVKIPVDQIKYLYYQKNNIFDDNSGEITVIKKNDLIEELPNVENAFDIENNFTQHIVNKALNKNE